MWLGFLVLLGPCLPVWGVWVLVGLLFEICIVDASIFRQLETVVGESNSFNEFVVCGWSFLGWSHVV